MVEQKIIDLKKFEIRKFKVGIKGKGHLMMHGKTDEWVRWYEVERNKKKAEKNRGTLEQEMKRGSYKNEKGDFVIPAQNILRMIADAYGIMINNLAGAKREVDSSISVYPVLIPLKFESVEIDKRAVNIGRKVPDIRYRNKFSGWELDFEIFLRISLGFDEERFFTILKFAGDFVGLCDGRNIGFGRFEIKK